MCALGVGGEPGLGTGVFIVEGVDAFDGAAGMVVVDLLLRVDVRGTGSGEVEWSRRQRGLVAAAAVAGGGRSSIGHDGRHFLHAFYPSPFSVARLETNSRIAIALAGCEQRSGEVSPVTASLVESFTAKYASSRAQKGSSTPAFFDSTATTDKSMCYYYYGLPFQGSLAHIFVTTDAAWAAVAQ